MAFGRIDFDPALMARTYRRPLALAGLILDLAPVYAVLFLGWDAVALVMLYWLENVIIGLVTLARLLLTGARGGVGNLAGAVFMGAFFTVHYGMFCFVHGVFLVVLAELANAGNPPFPSPAFLVDYAIMAGPGLGLLAGGLLAWHFALMLQDTLAGAAPSQTALSDAMSAPYGRIIVLHFGIFAGFGALIALGQPMIGVLALILLDVAWGMYQAQKREHPESVAQPES